MTLPRFTLPLALAPLVLALPYAACSSSSPPADPAYADVAFEGSATDAALTSMLAAPVVDGSPLAASFDYPKNLTALLGTAIITFTWHDGQSTAMQLLPRPPARSFTGVLADLFGERSALAGGPTMTGKGYLLEFRTLDTNEPLFRVFTSATSYTPDATEWSKVATGLWTQLQVVSASFGGDQVTAGPYEGQLIKFCIGPWQ
jgi:hypothetical protein